MLIMMNNIIMHTGSLKIKIVKVLFWEGARVYVFVMLTIMDDHVTEQNLVCINLIL